MGRNNKRQVLVVEDHPITRRGIGVTIRLMKGFDVCAEAASLEEMEKLLSQTCPDIVVLDIYLRGGWALDEIPRILRKCPSAKVLVISGYDDPVFVREVLKRGAHGFISKSALPDEFLRALECVSRGEYYWPASVSLRSAGAERRAGVRVTHVGKGLTAREMQVFRLLGQWKNTHEIAAELGISAKTVEIHRMNLKRKLGVNSVMELVRVAVESQGKLSGNEKS